MMDPINFGPECLSWLWAKKSQGSICPLWTYHPKSLGCTSPLMLLSQRAQSPWDTSAAPCPRSMEVPCQYQDCIVLHLTRQTFLLNGKELACGGAKQSLPHHRVLWPWDVASSLLQTTSCVRCHAGSWAAFRLEVLAVCCPVSH